MKRNWIENALAAAAFFLTLIVYVKTLAPTVTFIDAGELAVECTTLGVAHPTGYPLFIMLGHLWTMLPMPGSPVYKLNLLSAVCASLSVMVFFKVTLRILRKVAGSGPDPAPDGVVLTIAFASALAYGFARTVWDQATAVEVYALHMLLAMCSMNLFLKAVWAERQDTRDYLAFGAVLGLSFTNHMTSLWLIPAMAFLFFKRNGIGKNAWILLLKMAGPFALMLTLYLYMPLRSAGHFPFHGKPEFDWGEVGRGWGKFVYHVTARYYRYWMFTGTWPKQLGIFFASFPYQVAIIGFAPMALGIYRLFRRDKPLLIFLLLLIGTCVGSAVNYGIGDIDSYFMLAFIASLWLMAAGLHAMAERRPKLAPAALLIPALALVLNYRANDLSQDHLAQDYTYNMVNNLEPNAILFGAQWSTLDSPFWYLQKEERYRPDVILIESGLLEQTWYLDEMRRLHPDIMAGCDGALRDYEADVDRKESGRSYDPAQLTAHYTAFMNALIDSNIAARPIYFTTELFSAHPGVAAKYEKLPAGLAFRYVASRPAIRPWNISFNFDRFLSYPADPSNEQQRGIYDAAARGVEHSAQFQAMYGHRDEAAGLMQLASRLRAKVQQ